MSDFFKNTSFWGWSSADEIVALAKEAKIGNVTEALNDYYEKLPHWKREDTPRDRMLELVAEMAKLIKDVRWFEADEIRTYKVDGWGYDQTNYENLELIGEVGSYYVGRVNNHHFYKIPKSVEGSGVKMKDGSRKSYYNIDSVRSTHWSKPYSEKEIIDQSTYNMYCGH
jgi:hypothetical protein